MKDRSASSLPTLFSTTTLHSLVSAHTQRCKRSIVRQQILKRDISRASCHFQAKPLQPTRSPSPMSSVAETHASTVSLPPTTFPAGVDQTQTTTQPEANTATQPRTQSAFRLNLRRAGRAAEVELRKISVSDPRSLTIAQKVHDLLTDLSSCVQQYRHPSEHPMGAMKYPYTIDEDNIIDMLSSHLHVRLTTSCDLAAAVCRSDGTISKHLRALSHGPTDEDRDALHLAMLPSIDSWSNLVWRIKHRLDPL